MTILSDNVTAENITTYTSTTDESGPAAINAVAAAEPLLRTKPNAHIPTPGADLSDVRDSKHATCQ